ncbi:MAG: glycosyltransferase [Myxococcales bacterium]|nr:glycosyltransferase [Myxococcales bacterium]
MPNALQVSRDAVLATLESAALASDLFATLEHAGRVLKRAFSAEQQPALRAVLLSLVAKSIERGAEGAEEPQVAQAPSPTPASSANVAELGTRVRAAVAAGDFVTAASLSAALVRLVPGDADARITNAHVALCQGNLKLCQDDLLHAGFICPASDTERREDIAVTFVELGRAWSERGDRTMCRLQLERALRLDPECEAARELARSIDKGTVAADGSVKRNAIAMSNEQPVSVTPNRIGRAPLGSIVIANRHGLALLGTCLASVERHTPIAHELILVDDGSCPQTREYLRSYAAARPHVTIVAAQDRRGGAANTNLGTSVAASRYVVWLASNAVVTAGWLEGLLAVFHAHPNTGVVGPRTNIAMGQQFVREAAYDSPASLDAFAAAWSVAHRAESTRANHLAGACIVARSQVFATVGGLDENFGDGPFASTDFVWRARLARFGCRVAEESFVHQDEAESRLGSANDGDQSAVESFELLKAKWGIAPSQRLADGFPKTIVPPASVVVAIPLAVSSPNPAASRSAVALTNTPSALAQPAPVIARARVIAAAPALAIAAIPTAPAIPAVSANPAAPAIAAMVPVSAVSAAPLAQLELATPAERQALFTQGEGAAEAGDWHRALEVFEELARVAPSYLPAHVGVASAAFALGDVPRGASALDRACELEPTNVSLRLQHAVALAHGNLPEGALAAYTTVLESEPHSLEALLGAAQAARRLRRYVDAIELLERASAAMPDHPDVLVALGTLAAELGDRRSLEHAVNSLRRVAPDHPALPPTSDAAHAPRTSGSATA